MSWRPRNFSRKWVLRRFVTEICRKKLKTEIRNWKRLELHLLFYSHQTVGGKQCRQSRLCTEDTRISTGKSKIFQRKCWTASEAHKTSVFLLWFNNSDCRACPQPPDSRRTVWQLPQSGIGIHYPPIILPLLSSSWNGTYSISFPSQIPLDQIIGTDNPGTPSTYEYSSSRQLLRHWLAYH